MENNTEAIENNLRDESSLNDTENEISSASIYGKGLGSSILGRSYRAPDIPKRYIEPTVLDTSLPYIPVYTHLKIHDLKPIERPTTPPIISELRLKGSDDYMVPESQGSSKASPSTGRTSKKRSSLTDIAGK
ncbi:WD repeat-containing protein on Y chromosome [Osmia lignaria lignaria]|uniref:WD repeat-containing protein on Y chromosome n=1 Tax=Osmia lignaria lignaria TaxID=1437193 RepID=UPI00402BE26E